MSSTGDLPCHHTSAVQEVRRKRAAFIQQFKGVRRARRDLTDAVEEDNLGPSEALSNGVLDPWMRCVSNGVEIMAIRHRLRVSKIAREAVIRPDPRARGPSDESQSTDRAEWVPEDTPAGMSAPAPTPRTSDLTTFAESFPVMASILKLQ